MAALHCATFLCSQRSLQQCFLFPLVAHSQGCWSHWCQHSTGIQSQIPAPRPGEDTHAAPLTRHCDGITLTKGGSRCAAVERDAAQAGAPSLVRRASCGRPALRPTSREFQGVGGSTSGCGCSYVLSTFSNRRRVVSGCKRVCLLPSYAVLSSYAVLLCMVARTHFKLAEYKY
jgi:hypothetical protein